MTPTMWNLPHSISELEFESLPPAVRRKYFSSLERLRLAQDGFTPSLPSFRPRSQRRLSSLHTRRKSVFDPAELSLQNHNNRNRLQKRKSIAKRTLVNTDTAALFASLPPAVRRKQFSKEEQILFANEAHTIILDAADELVHRRCHQTASHRRSFVGPRPQTSYIPHHDGQSSFFLDGADDADDEDDKDDKDDDEVVSQERGTPQNDSNMTEYSMDSFKWLDEEPELDLRLDDYHRAIAETAQRQAATPTRRTFKRNLSLSTMSLRRSSISSSQPNNIDTRSSTNSMMFRPPLSPAPNNMDPRSSTNSMMFRPPLSPAQTSSPHRPKASISSIDPRATFYQDPAARMKLRVYLASASKFDEAVEFGFPSLQDKASLCHSRPMTSPRMTDESRRTFLTDDTPSLSNDDDDSHDDTDFFQDPRTPVDMEFQQNRKSQKSSHDRYSVRPQVPRGTTEPYAQSTTLNREMTIHMTLTRPDLRSPEEANPSAHVTSLPAEHSELPPCDNSLSIWDTLPHEESRMKKMWKKLMKRQM